jgi:hypothetical protein
LVVVVLLVGVTVGTLSVVAINALHRPTVVPPPGVGKGLRANDAASDESAASHAATVDGTPTVTSRNTESGLDSAADTAAAEHQPAHASRPKHDERDERPERDALLEREARPARGPLDLAPHPAAAQVSVSRSFASETPESGEVLTDSETSGVVTSGLLAPVTAKPFLGEEFGFER